MLTLAFSRRLAIVAGLLLPVLETARRWRQWPGPIETWPSWLDDYLIAALLLLGVWMGRAGAIARDGGETAHAGRFRKSSWLTAAWGFACGMGFGSMLGQLNHVIHPSGHIQDPSGLAHGWVVLIKAGLVAVGVVGLLGSMRRESAAT